MIQNSKILVAHRGAPYYFQENTIDSFAKAVTLGADMVEFDIRRTADGVLVAHHDPFILFNNKEYLLSEISFDKLRSISSEIGFQVPDIEQVIKALSGKTGLVIEFKEKNCEREVLDIVYKNTDPGKCIFTSFQPEILLSIKNINSELQTGFLFETLSNTVTEITFDILCPRESLLTSNHDFFSSQKRGGKSIAVWTVDDSMALKMFLDDPVVDIIITNKIDRALQLRNIRKEIRCDGENT